ncbi:MAG: hypothetical protein KIT16_13090 [Rhodospirillaceae bacterium]|nr:hypothetical protein [Rhodospirillaceae bacterium]
MITAISQFKAPPGTTLEQATAMFKASVPAYAGYPGLIRKYYLLGDDGYIRGVYLWESRAAAEKLYTEAWRKGVRERFGSDPTVSYFETPVVIDNLTRETIAA